MTPKALLIYRDEKEKQEKKQLQMADLSSWMTGAYVLKAIGQVLNKNSSYPERVTLFKLKRYGKITLLVLIRLKRMRKMPEKPLRI